MMTGVAGSIRQRGKQSWEVRAFVGKDSATGKKQYVTKTIRGERRGGRSRAVRDTTWRSGGHSGRGAEGAAVRTARGASPERGLW